MTRKSINPADCPPHKTYTGIVTTISGTHKRILTRTAESHAWPWKYFGDSREVIIASDDQVSELQEIDPFDLDELKRAKTRAAQLEHRIGELEDDLTVERNARRQLSKENAGVSEQRVREIVTETFTAALVQAAKDLIETQGPS